MCRPCGHPCGWITRRRAALLTAIQLISIFSPLGRAPTPRTVRAGGFVTDRFPIDIVHRIHIRQMGHIDVHPHGIAEVHSCRAQHTLHIVQRLAHLLLKILWKTAIGFRPS